MVSDLPQRERKIMSSNLAAQQKLAERLASVLRRFEHEGGSVESLADRVGETSRDLRRWAEGTKLPGHVLSMLLGELPRHLADELIRPTGLRLIARDGEDGANALLAASRASALSSEITGRHADGHYCHRDRAEVAEHAKRLIADLEPLTRGV
jgi:hypothetical protein